MAFCHFLRCCCLFYIFTCVISRKCGTLRTCSLEYGRYKLNVYFNKQDWDGAKSECSKINSHLVNIKDEGLSDLLKRKLPNDANFWIGASFSATDAVWKWSDGTYVTGFDKWNEAKNEPTNIGDCSRYRAGSWYVMACSKRNWYICQRASCKPVIESIIPQDCNSSLLLKWTPDSDATGYIHEINITSVDDRNKVIRKSVKPTEDATINTMIDNLNSSSYYDISITGCTDEYNPGNQVARLALTGGIPNRVQRLVLNGPENDQSCFLSWEPPLNVDKINITGYEVSITSVLRERSPRINQSEPIFSTKYIPGSRSNYSIQTRPNKNYSVQVRPQSCAGYGQPVAVQGDCVTDVARPDFLSQPIFLKNTTSEDGSLDMQLITPSEINGVISCIFVIVSSANNSDANDTAVQNYNISDLLSANSSEQSQEEYIAVALNISSFSSSILKVQLGKNTTTSCDVGVTDNQTRNLSSSLPDQVFFGNDPPLDIKLNYSVYIVSATPTGTTILLQHSKQSKVFRSDEKSETPTSSPTSHWIVAAILVLLLLIALISAVVFYLRRRQGPSCHEKEDQDILNKPKKKQAREEDHAPLAEMDTAGQALYENVQNIRNKVTQSTDINLADMHNAYNGMRTNRNQSFRDQFERIVEEATLNMPSVAFASASALKRKNRYKNILPYDHSRVVVDQAESGYINACYISGYNGEKKFIATQGPLPATEQDFWLMVVQQRVEVIVMLTKCFEAGKKKCQKYWPDCHKTRRFGEISVENSEEASFGGYVRRTIRLSSQSQMQKNLNTVYQYQCVSWPDHDIPHATSSIIRMHRDVMKRHEALPGNAPIIVHCSAGAGRSGTFIGYDILLDESKDRNAVDVYGCVTRMRTQRVDMVQNHDQYGFLHQLILEAHLFGDTDCSADEVEQIFNKKISSEDGTANGIATEFVNLSMINRIRSRKSKKKKGSSMKTGDGGTPTDAFEVSIFMEEGESVRPRSNAVWIQTYDESAPIMASKGPQEAHNDYFWRVVLDNNVNTVVMLTEPSEVKEKQCAQYWPSAAGESVKFSDTSVLLLQETTADLTVERELKVTRRRQEKIVKMFQFTGWPSNRCPKDGEKIVELIEKMQENTRTVEKAAALVHCSDGFGRSGTFCAIVNLIERLKCENRADIFRTVKDLKDCRTNMVQTEDQYVFCYRAVIDYLKSFGLYSNFRS